MLILQPQRAFPIVRQIANHLDVATYYVQAVVRNADGDTIATVQLEDKGGQRFQKKWQVPIDGSGQGSYISIVTSVYTDSGYTTKSSNYGDEETTYLIFDRVMPAMRGGGGQGNIDIASIRRVIADELDKRKEVEEPEEKEVEFPEIPRYEESFSALASAIANLQGEVNKIPKEKVDLSGITNGLQNLAQMVNDKPVTPETDIMPMLTEFRNMTNLVLEAMNNFGLETREARDDIKETVIATIKDEMENAEFAQETVVRRRPKAKVEVPQQGPAFDIKSLV